MSTIAVLGGGNGAFAAAADLKLRGFQINLCEVPELGANIREAQARGGIELEAIGLSDIPSGFAALDKIGTDPQEALQDAEIVLVTVPAFAHRRFVAFAAPYVYPDQTVVFMPGGFGGSLELTALLSPGGVERCPVLVETECLPYSGFKNGPASVQVSGFKRGLKIAAFPGKEGDKALATVAKLYPTVQLADNILETGLRSGNMIAHPPVMLLNAGRIESAQRFRFYWEGITPAVGRVIETLEQERMNVGQALGLALTPMHQVFLGWYGHQGARGATLSEVLSTNPVYAIDWAPATLSHRFVLEDIPYGLVPMETLGQGTGVPTPVTSSLIDLGSTMLERDLRVEGRSLTRLGLGNRGLTEILQFVQSGE
jgi:opine dehydrogenase